MSTTLSDAQLVSYARRGVPSAWQLIWRRYSSPIRGYLRQRVGNDEVVDDLLQETFLVLHQSLGRLERPEALRWFLFGTAARVASAARRAFVRRSRHVRLTSSGQLPDRPHGDDRAGARDTLRQLEAALDGLEPRTRLAFQLRDVYGLELEEVAVTLHVSRSTAIRMLKRARRWLLRQRSLG